MAPQRVIEQPTQFRTSEEMGTQNILTPLSVQEEAPVDKGEDKELTPLRTMMDMETGDDNLASFRNASTISNENSFAKLL